jgi:competence protein ComEA
VRFSGAVGAVPREVSGNAIAALLPPGSPAQGAPAPLNINAATARDLEALPGLGPTRAAAILQYRQEHGPFAAVDELARVPGLGTGTVARLRDRVSAR